MEFSHFKFGGAWKKLSFSNWILQLYYSLEFSIILGRGVWYFTSYSLITIKAQKKFLAITQISLVFLIYKLGFLLITLVTITCQNVRTTQLFCKLIYKMAGLIYVLWLFLFFVLLELQSYWEIPAVAQYISLFRTCFNLPEIEIEVTCNLL